MESSRKSSFKISKLYEAEADKLFSEAETAKKNKKISLLQQAVENYDKALQEHCNSPLAIHLSILACYEQLIETCDSEDKKKYAKILIKKIENDKLREEVTDKHDLYDIHYMMFKAHRLLGNHAKALRAAKEVIEAYAKLKDLYPKTVKVERKKIKNYNQDYIKKYEKDYEEALSYIELYTEKTPKKSLKEEKDDLPKQDLKKQKSKKNIQNLSTGEITIVNEPTQNLSLEQENVPYVINNFGGTINCYGTTNITINNITINDLTEENEHENTKPPKTNKKRKISKDKRTDTTKKSTANEEELPRIEIVSNKFHVNGKKVKGIPSEVKEENGVYTVDGVEIVDHGLDTPKFDVIERARLNEATDLPSPIISQRKKLKPIKRTKLKETSNESDLREIELLGESEDFNGKPAVLFKAPMPRLIELATKQSSETSKSEESTVDLVKIDAITRNQWRLFKQSEIENLIIDSTSQSLQAVAKKPQSTVLKESIENVQAKFTGAYQAYVKADYETALKDFAETLLQCKALAKSDKQNSAIHKKNALLAAHYLDHITTLAFQKARTPKIVNEKDKNDPLKVDSVTTLLEEEFSFVDPCEFPTTQLCNQPLEDEFNFARNFLNPELSHPHSCSIFQKAKSAVDQTQHETTKAKSPKIIRKRQPSKTEAKNLKKNEQIVNAHRFRESNETQEKSTETITSNSQDLHRAINATIMVEALTEDQVRTVVKNVIDLSLTEAIVEENEAPKKKSKTDKNKKQKVETKKLEKTSMEGEAEQRSLPINNKSKNSKQRHPKPSQKRKDNKASSRYVSFFDKNEESGIVAEEAERPIKKNKTENNGEQQYAISFVSKSERQSITPPPRTDFNVSTTYVSFFGNSEQKEGKRQRKARTIYNPSW